MALPADDDVVVHDDAERLRHLDNHARHFNVGAATGVGSTSG